ncbi:conjugative transposon protein TraM [Sphingobacterium athyrii]|uniref:Conjugative transposon protein TraM n=1 Tax=Sphingobacterium athyrii TaxID=2152717 RepID=A0A363NUK7_9SPHI|nr:conjugative transposon protein TraM [Sphingobacterium athyrii]PUV24430.1 conjugative transposon protein TraM [Sphingobacterium athyrii]
MEEKENKRISLIVDDGNTTDNSSSIDGRSKVDKLKKPLIFGLMGIVFIACLYLIFKPKDSREEGKDTGLKNAVPEATDKGLQADKQKAYEKEILDEREAAKRNSLMSLSDYWNSGGDSSIAQNPISSPDRGTVVGNPSISGYGDNSLNSYRSAQNTLSTFYQDDDREKLELRRKVGQLESRLSEKDVSAGPNLKDQLTLMEKSYEMASKYLPTGLQPTTTTVTTSPEDSSTIRPVKNEQVAKLKGVEKTIVSALYREPDDSSFFAGLDGDRHHRFFTVDSKLIGGDISKNSIRAMILETKTITSEGTVKLRLQEDAIIAGQSVPKGSEFEASAKFQDNRLMLKVSSVAVNGNIIPVEILGYDMSGQIGLSVPRSDEINAAGEIAANMSQSSGMNISMSRSSGQQIAGDLSRGLIQGVSGYFSKKLRATKVTLKAGHQVLLVTKK